MSQADVREPKNLREWISPGSTSPGRLFTCGRPGRAIFNSARVSIGEDSIDRWVGGLPTFEVLHMVSLLGRKPGPSGYSEFEYYPFRSSYESGAEPTFQEWLDQRYGPRFTVHEFPTEDAGIPAEKRDEVGQAIRELLARDLPVVVIDSAGVDRTSIVCRALGYEPLPQAGS